MKATISAIDIKKQVFVKRYSWLAIQAFNSLSFSYIAKSGNSNVTRCICNTVKSFLVDIKKLIKVKENL